MARTNTLTLTADELNNIIAQAVAMAMSAQTTSTTKSSVGKGRKAPSTKSKTVSKKVDKPSTYTEAIEKAYGSKAERTKFVATQKKNAQAKLKADKVKFTLTESGNIQFVPFAEQTKGRFASRTEFKKYRESFRAQYKYC